MRGHMKIHSAMDRFSCEICGKEFLQKKYYKVHIKIHEKPSVACKACGEEFLTKKTYRTHENPQGTSGVHSL